MTRIGINGFGRIGRMVARLALARAQTQVVAINDPRMSPESAALLLRKDSLHGDFDAQVEVQGQDLRVNAAPVALAFSTSCEINLWREQRVDVILECSGRARSHGHWQFALSQGVRRVVISAPVDDVRVPNIVVGVNDNAFDPNIHAIVSAASCTTNCIAPVLAVMHRGIGIVHGAMTTVHAITNSQRLLDDHHDDLRRARAAFSSLIPTSTGSARTIGKIIPELAGKLNGLAVRIPTTSASLSDLVLELARPTSADEVHQQLDEAAASSLKGILATSREPLVSADIVNNQNSCVVDVLSTQVIDSRLVKILAWYDNETGYAARMLDLALR